MVLRPAAEIGDRWEDIDTPALVVDLDALDANIAKMAAFASRSNIRLRPHAKTHKCPAIARKQLEAGAVGICCQKVSEAEAMADGGIADILVTNQVVGKKKLRRLAALSLRIDVAICADNAENVAALDAVAREFDTTLPVLVEIDVGSERCGVAPGEDAAELAKRIADANNLRFSGLQAYQGRAQHLRQYEARREAIASACRDVTRTIECLKREGLDCEIIGGAGTGTYAFEAASGVYNEMQVGSYVFMDGDYARNLNAKGKHDADFSQSLFVHTNVVSIPGPDRVVTDAGLKSYTMESGLPGIFGADAADVTGVSDEHTSICFLTPGSRPGLGDGIRLIPGHCDPTVNLHDWLIGVRNGRVECIWPIAARGASA